MATITYEKLVGKIKNGMFGKELLVERLEKESNTENISALKRAIEGIDSGAIEQRKCIGCGETDCMLVFQRHYDSEGLVCADCDNDSLANHW